MSKHDDFMKEDFFEKFALWCATALLVLTIGSFVFLCARAFLTTPAHWEEAQCKNISIKDYQENDYPTKCEKYKPSNGLDKQ